MLHIFIKLTIFLQMPQTCDAYFSTEITNHLFQKNAKRFESAFLFKFMSLEKTMKNSELCNDWRFV